MFRSFTLGKVAGIELKMHPTFLIVPLLLLWDGPKGLLFGGLLFTLVVLHELGHALAARRIGIPTRDILLTPIGGIASLQRMPARPQDELFVTVAGPAVNVALATLGYLTLLAVGPAFPRLAQELLIWFVLENVVLAVFNLIPAFPMDGGRLLRAFLTLRWGDRLRATRTAAKVGRVMAVLLGVLGLFYNPMLIAIAVFVYFAGAAEEASVNGGLMGTLLSAAMRRRRAPQPFVEPEILFSRPLSRRRPNMVVEGEYTVV